MIKKLSIAYIFFSSLKSLFLMLPGNLILNVDFYWNTTSSIDIAFVADNVL